jgi:anti-sigma factor RsiW
MKVGPLSNDELMERYEDALFALLTDEMASAEGKRLHEENERLKSDPHFALPEGLSARMEEAIRKAYSDPGKKKLVSAMKRMLARAAVFILAFGIITSGLFFTVSAFRARVMNMFHGLNEEFTALTHRIISSGGRAKSRI